jgi:hypothetical protein
MSLTGTTPLVAPLTGRDTGLADAGAMFVASNPTIGTGQVGFATNTTFAIGELNPFIFLYNGGNLNIYPLYVRLHVTVVNTTGVLPYIGVVVDQGIRGNVTGTVMTVVNSNIGSQLALSPVGFNPSAVKSGAQVTMGLNALTAATSQRRIIASAILRPVKSVVHDVYQLSFGSPDPTSTGMPLEGTLAIDRVINVPATVVGPGQCMGIVYWNAADTVGITMEAELCYGER